MRLAGLRSCSHASASHPPRRRPQIFGFFTTIGRAAGSLGPLVFGLCVQITGDQHSGFIVVVGLFAIGLVLLYQVDFVRGEARVSEEGEGGGEEMVGAPAAGAGAKVMDGSDGGVPGRYGSVS